MIIEVLWFLGNHKVLAAINYTFRRKQQLNFGKKLKICQV